MNKNQTMLSDLRQQLDSEKVSFNECFVDFFVSSLFLFCVRACMRV